MFARMQGLEEILSPFTHGRFMNNSRSMCIEGSDPIEALKEK